MNVIVEQRVVYGNFKFYPVNELAHKYAALLRQKTFDAQNLSDIKGLGVGIVINQQSIKI